MSLKTYRVKFKDYFLSSEEEEENKEIDKVRRFRFNLLQLFVWLVLLFFSFRYLSENDAERASLIKWLEIIYEKIQIFGRWFLGGEAQSLESQFTMKKSFEQLMSSYQESTCRDWQHYNEILSKYNELKNLKSEDFAKQQDNFSIFLSKYYRNFKEGCK